MSALRINYPALTIKAGSRALARIRERGLQPADVGILPGAAGGAKALGIQGLDLALFGDWLPRASRQRSLIGASIGSWRFASACLPDAVAAIRRLGELYTGQRFTKGVSMAEVSRSCRRMLDELLAGQDAEVLNNLHYRLNIVVVKSHGLLRHDHRGTLGLGLASVIGNNLHHALLASGSIPMIMQRVRDIPGAGPGTYRDGGLLDYHLDLPYSGDDIVLYPHFTDRVIPGWFDKGMPWRRGDAGRLQDVLLLAPSRDYLARLPHGKLPDRKDFSRYLGDDAGRKRYWRKAMEESQRLGDEFLELTDSGHLAKPMQAL